MPIEETGGVQGTRPPSEIHKQRPVDEKRLQKVCEEFESILIHQMMKTMRQTIPRAGFLEESKEREIFQSLFDEEISKAISKKKGLGLGQLLYQQLYPKKGEFPSGKEVLNRHEGLEGRDGSLVSPPRPRGGELPSTHRRDQKGSQVFEGRGNGRTDSIRSGD